jgi:hypothetical protein
VQKLNGLSLKQSLNMYKVNAVDESYVMNQLSPTSATSYVFDPHR